MLKRPLTSEEIDYKTKYMAVYGIVPICIIEYIK